MKKNLILFCSAILLAGCGATKQLPTQSGTTVYAIGDLYNQNGVKGIVVKVDDSGMHGTIMSLESSKDFWISDNDLKFETNAFYEDDGMKNMDAIEAYVNSGKANWTNFPLFNWARSLGDGWYIPSKNEALEIWVNMNGGNDAYKWTHSKFIKNDFGKFDAQQRKFGGAPLVDDRLSVGTNEPYTWYTSTEGEGGNAYSIGFEQSLKSELSKGFGSTKFAANLNLKKFIVKTQRSRAIHKF